MAMETNITDHLATIGVAVPSIGVLATWGWSMIRRRISADAKQVNEDRSYSQMLDNYKKERDEMRIEREKLVARMSVIETERNNAVAQVGRLTAEVEFLTHQVTDLKVLVEKLGASLEIARDEMQKSAVENAKLNAQLSYLTLLKDHPGEEHDPS